MGNIWPRSTIQNVSAVWPKGLQLSPSPCTAASLAWSTVVGCSLVSLFRAKSAPGTRDMELYQKLSNLACTSHRLHPLWYHSFELEKLSATSLENGSTKYLNLFHSWNIIKKVRNKGMIYITNIIYIYIYFWKPDWNEQVLKLTDTSLKWTGVYFNICV